jgi:restriction system protein
MVGGVIIRSTLLTLLANFRFRALREIVTDTGADRGILLAEAGFQRGAVEAANPANVQLTSLADLNVTTPEQISAARLPELFDRVEECNSRYWKIPKDQRIQDGLRFDVEFGYSGARVLEACKDILSRASVGRFPFRCETTAGFFMPELQLDFQSATQVVLTVDGLLRELEAKLTVSEAKRR